MNHSSEYENRPNRLTCATQFRSCDDSFRRLQLTCLYIKNSHVCLFVYTQLRVANCTIATSQMNQGVFWVDDNKAVNMLALAESVHTHLFFCENYSSVEHFQGVF